MGAMCFSRMAHCGHAFLFSRKRVVKNNEKEMWEMKQRILSLLLALTLLCAMLPQIALPARAEDAYSGKCGDNLTWRFEPSTGTLTIKGSGKMYNYDWGTQPWHEHMDSIKQIVFPDGLTSIGALAFDRCTGLTSVTLPEGLTSIDGAAFSECTALRSISFPAGLTSIGDSAFSYCTALRSISFPAGLTSIGEWAFSDCTGMRSVFFPEGLTEIGEHAFSGCTWLKSFSVAKENANYSSDANGILFNKQKTELIRYPCGRIGSYTIPNSVTVIGNVAFSGCTELTSVTFPDGLTSIGEEAFTDCAGLTSVTLPDGLTSIGDYAFCDCTGLTSVTFPNGLTSIGEGAFEDCSRLISVVIPDSVVQIGTAAFGFYFDRFWNDCREENFTIYGYKGTAAQTYAQENGIKFVPLDPQSGFADAKPKQYYYEAMLWALGRGITSGTSRVTFSPNDTCTRGQVMTFLYAAKGKPEANWDNNPFVDVKKSKFYYKPVLWAVQNGITSGMDATHFQPNGGCTRAQVVTFLWAMRGKPEPKAGNNPFTDIKKSNWYYKAVLWASQNGITSGVDATHFGPNQTCTRGQVVTFLYALLGDK